MAKVPYLSAVGALTYLATCTRPDIAHAVGVLARFNSDPGEAHWKAVKHLVRYLKKTADCKLTYGGEALPGGSEPFLTFCDADHAGCKDGGKSMGAHRIKLANGAVSWSSKLQTVVALSTTEAEYCAAVEGGKEAIWMRQLLGEMGYEVGDPSTLCMDDQSAVTVSKNPEHFGRMKHVDLRPRRLRDEVEGGKLVPKFVPTEENAADLLTKPLAKPKVEHFREQLGLVLGDSGGA